MQLPLIVPQSGWRPLRISELPEFRNVKRVGIDTETKDPTLTTLGPGVRRGAYITGISFAIEDGPKHYVPLRHSGGDNVEDVQLALGWFREQAKDFKGEVVGANLGYDLDFLAEEKIEFPEVKKYRDVQICEPLLDDQALSYSLEKISNKYLGIGKNETMLRQAAQDYKINPKKDMHLLPARFVGEYAEDDSNHPLLILRRQEKLIEEQDLWQVYNLESDLLPVLVRMRRRGVRVDLSRLTEVENWSSSEERKALAEIKSLTGIEVPFNSVWKAEYLAKPLESIGIKVPLTPKTKKPSIDKAFLSNIQHPVAAAILRARRVNKIRTTFAQSIRNHAIGDRIHCTFNQLRSSTDEDEDGEGAGARFGRLSSSNPNMQQQPARDPEIGPLWRSIFIGEEGEEWCSADYSSQEPRLTVHYANSVRLGKTKVRTERGTVWVDADESAKAMAQRYRDNPATDLHQELANIIYKRTATKDERRGIKDIFLGLCYGMGGKKLCKSLGFPTIMAVREPKTQIVFEINTPEGQELISQGQKIYEGAGADGQKLLDRFDENVPFVRALSRICMNAASKNGYIRTFDGRKCRFAKDEVGNLMEIHKALNKAIQGTAAGQTKQACVDLDRAGIPIRLQIHDEIASSIKNRKEGELIAEIMENCYKLTIPSRVDLEIGKSWGDAK